MVDLQFPSTLDEACELVSSSSGEGRIIAGGVALMILIHHQLYFPTRLISIKRIPGLDQIRFDKDEGLSIGALVTHHQVESSPLVRNNYPALAECIHHVGNLRVRNMGDRYLCGYFIFLQFGLVDASVKLLYGDDSLAPDAPCPDTCPEDAQEGSWIAVVVRLTQVSHKGPHVAHAQVTHMMNALG